MSTAKNDDDTSPDICANCGKGEDSSSSLKACTACKLVKYCSRDCQIAHRPQHKKECRRRAKELHDIELFKHPPPQYEDCPICFLRMPSLMSGIIYMPCCGKNVCNACSLANASLDITKQLCAFCRIQNRSSDEELIERINKRVDVGDKEAIFYLGSYYFDGRYGYPQDYGKALELYHRSAELGNALAYYNIGCSYDGGQGVTRDEKKAIHYWEIAAMKGNLEARYNLGIFEGNSGNWMRAVKHHMIAVRSGCNDSLSIMQELLYKGRVTKEEYTEALHAYKAYLDEIKSDERDKAAAAVDDCKYID